MPLHPELQDYISQNQALIERLKSLVEGLSGSQFNWRPNGKTWSIGEAILHSNMTVDAYVQPIQNAIERGKRDGLTGEGRFRHGWFMNWFIRTMEPPPKMKVKAPKSFLPPVEPVNPITVTEEFVQRRQHYMELIEQADGLHLAKVRFPSPLTSLLKMSLGQGFALMAAHDRRHLWQAEQTRQHPDFPA